MAKIVVNPSAELPPRRGDIELTLDQLSTLSLFTTVKKAPSFEKFPGSQILRRYRTGEAICYQGQPGRTAFYLLTAKDLQNLCDQCENSTGSPPEWFAEMRQTSTGLCKSSSAVDSSEQLRLGTARLMTGQSVPFVGKRSWWQGWKRGASSLPQVAKPLFIPNDGPSDINYDTREAPIFAGEVFGEMSCLTRQPRSATVIADTDCYALEFFRNILDQLRRDPTYKKQSEQKYRDRVMEGHLRKLSVFKHLTAEQFKAIQNRVELIDFAPGSVIWDEGDASDSMVIVRSGIVQVLQEFPWKLEPGAIRDWDTLAKQFRENRTERPALERIWKTLLPDVQAALEDDASTPSPQIQQQLIEQLNQLAQTKDLVVAKDVAQELSDSVFLRETSNFPAKARDWDQLQLRRGNRVLWDVLFGDAIESAPPAGVTRVLTYLGRGDILGEIGLALKEPRSATCVAYSHPESDRESTNVELVKIPAAVFEEIVLQSPQARSEIDRLIRERKQRDTERSQPSLNELADSQTSESLGLLQGQKLMLIDLDRCTRCGDCVQACISTHDDGHSRLYLDGPRYGKYLIPSSCRQCRDPVCMIGCPVGSIQQGANGQIEITDWCIGCSMCERQCPYDSIQMHDTALIAAGTPGWCWSADAKIVGNHWMQERTNSKQWQVGAAPHEWGIDTVQTILASSRKPQNIKQVYFRLQFHVGDLDVPEYRLTVTSQGSDVATFLNGRPVAITQDARQKKKGEFIGQVTTSDLRSGVNLLAVSVKPPATLGNLLLDARLDAMTAVDEQTEEKLVTETAVVCDQCASLAGDRHACVYACPHEAAMRIDAWTEFPSSG